MEHHLPVVIFLISWVLISRIIFIISLNITFQLKCRLKNSLRTSRNECLTKSRVTKRKTEVTSWTILSIMTWASSFLTKSMDETVILRQNHVNYKSPLRPWPLTLTLLKLKISPFLAHLNIIFNQFIFGLFLKVWTLFNALNL